MSDKEKLELTEEEAFVYYMKQGLSLGEAMMKLAQKTKKDRVLEIAHEELSSEKEKGKKEKAHGNGKNRSL